ncbi:hypothetical protein LINPERPRIM_LOCUS39539, partial [Linum perenne]
WVIVEFQGIVEVQPTFEDKIQILEIGHLCRPSDDDKYTLMIGYHELSGTKVTLKKPLTVLKKVKPIEIGDGKRKAWSSTSSGSFGARSCSRPYLKPYSPSQEAGRLVKGKDSWNLSVGTEALVTAYSLRLPPFPAPAASGA